MSSPLLIPSTYNYDRQQTVQTVQGPRTSHRRRFKRIATKSITACGLIFLVANQFIIGDISYSQLRRSLQCANRKMKKARYLGTEPVEDCEIVYPGDDVATTIEATSGGTPTSTDDTIDTGTLGGDFYYAPPDPDAGLYYPPENVEAITDDTTTSNGTTPDGEVGDPSALVPDVEEPQYYSEVDTTLLGLYEPQVYEPVVETTDPVTGEVIEPVTNTPENTTAYIVTITSCPEIYYDAPNSEISDPAGDIYEASAIIKHEVCDSYEADTTTTRNLQEGVDVYTM